MKKYMSYVAALALVLSLPAMSAGAADKTATTTETPAKHFVGEDLTKDAKVSLEEAREIALKSSPGKITDEELEKEEGGTGLRYSFDIKQGTVVREVGVDAKTGKVLEDAKEGPNPD